MQSTKTISQPLWLSSPLSKSFLKWLLLSLLMLLCLGDWTKFRDWSCGTMFKKELGTSFMTLPAISWFISILPWRGLSKRELPESIKFSMTSSKRIYQAFPINSWLPCTTLWDMVRLKWSLFKIKFYNTSSHCTSKWMWNRRLTGFWLTQFLVSHNLTSRHNTKPFTKPKEKLTKLFSTSISVTNSARNLPQLNSASTWFIVWLNFEQKTLDSSRIKF